MKRLLIVALVLAGVLAAGPAAAQAPVTGANKIGWDQAAPTLGEAQNYTYKYFADNATTGITLASVTCAGTASPYQCEVPFPAFTPGNHTITLTAGNLAGESVKSAPLSFAFVVTPGAPVNLRIK
jgi:hypothetical protein